MTSRSEDRVTAFLQKRLKVARRVENTGFPRYFWGQVTNTKIADPQIGSPRLRHKNWMWMVETIISKTIKRGPSVNQNTRYVIYERPSIVRRWIDLERVGRPRRSSTWRSSRPSKRTSAATSATKSLRSLSSLVIFR